MTRNLGHVVGVISVFWRFDRERQHCQNAIVSRGAVPNMMERWPASPRAARDVVLAQMQDNDAIVALLAYRYGSIVPGTGISYTHLEVLEALRRNKVVIGLFIDPERGRLVGADIEDASAAQESLRSLKELLRNLVSPGLYSSKEAIEAMTYQALGSLSEEVDARRASDRELSAEFACLPRPARERAGMECEYTLEVYADFPSDLASPEEAMLAGVESQHSVRRVYCLVNGERACWCLMRADEVRHLQGYNALVRVKAHFDCVPGSRTGRRLVVTRVVAIGWLLPAEVDAIRRREFKGEQRAGCLHLN